MADKIIVFDVGWYTAYDTGGDEVHVELQPDARDHSLEEVAWCYARAQEYFEARRRRGEILSRTRSTAMEGFPAGFEFLGRLIDSPKELYQARQARLEKLRALLHGRPADTETKLAYRLIAWAEYSTWLGLEELPKEDEIVASDEPVPAGS